MVKCDRLEPCETRLALGGLGEGRTPVSAAAVSAAAQECPPPPRPLAMGSLLS